MRVRPHAEPQFIALLSVLAGSSWAGGSRFAVSRLGVNRLFGSRLLMDSSGTAEAALGRADQLAGPVSGLLEPLPDLFDPILQPVGRVPSPSKHGTRRQRPAHIAGSQAKALAAGLFPSSTAISVGAATVRCASDNHTLRI